jgi:S1 RNA binding domain protein
VRDYLSEDDEVTVKVLRMNQKGRYELSLRQSEAAPSVGQREFAAAADRRPNAAPIESRPAPPPRTAATFEDRLSRFLKDSEQRQHDIKRHMETKRGRR